MTKSLEVDIFLDTSSIKTHSAYSTNTAVFVTAQFLLISNIACHHRSMVMVLNCLVFQRTSSCVFLMAKMKLTRGQAPFAHVLENLVNTAVNSVVLTVMLTSSTLGIPGRRYSLSQWYFIR